MSQQFQQKRELIFKTEKQDVSKKNVLSKFLLVKFLCTNYFRRPSLSEMRLSTS